MRVEYIVYPAVLIITLAFLAMCLISATGV